jgi:hypothetical protein
MFSTVWEGFCPRFVTVAVADSLAEEDVLEKGTKNIKDSCAFPYALAGYVDGDTVPAQYESGIARGQMVMFSVSVNPMQVPGQLGSYRRRNCRTTSISEGTGSARTGADITRPCIESNGSCDGKKLLWPGYVEYICI